MIANRLVEMIETHSGTLARGLMARLLSSPWVEDMRKVPPEELQERVQEVYANLRDWLLHKTERDIERCYTAIGARRAAQEVRLSSLIYAILATKEHLWEFLDKEGFVDRPLELYQELELLRMVEQFFDRAVCYAARGYETARVPEVRDAA